MTRAEMIRKQREVGLPESWQPEQPSLSITLKPAAGGGWDLQIENRNGNRMTSCNETGSKVQSLVRVALYREMDRLEAEVEPAEKPAIVHPPDAQVEF